MPLSVVDAVLASRIYIHIYSQRFNRNKNNLNSEIKKWNQEKKNAKKKKEFREQLNCGASYLSIRKTN